MSKQIKQYTVKADRETGAWIGEPEYIGMVDEQDWLAKEDTDAAHYDTYGVESPGDGEVKVYRAIEVVWQ